MNILGLGCRVVGGGNLAPLRISNVLDLPFWGAKSPGARFPPSTVAL